MDIDTLQELTGRTVASAQQASVEAQIARTQTLLEDALGFTLDPSIVDENLYNELGKTTNEWSWSSVDNETLLPADAVVGAYRLFSFNRADSLLSVDPFSAIHAVKLVVGDVTIYTFDPRQYSAYGVISKDIALSRTWWNQYFRVMSEIRGPVQLAVDADWLWGYADMMPTDLQYLWIDMVDHYSDSKRQIKSESIGAHSYTRDITAPESLPTNVSTLSRYAGPRGSVRRTVTL